MNIKKIVIYIESKNFKIYESTARLRRIADEFMCGLDIEDYENRSDYISSISEINFFESEEYNRVYDDIFLTNISNFRNELLIVIDKKYNPTNIGELVHNANPPIEAYEYKGFSPSFIKESKRDYGLLVL